jgi:formate dehydrogenase major subunit
MERGDLDTVYVIGENPAQSEADIQHTRHLLEGLEFMVVQDIFMTKTAEYADVVFPASASWCESEGTVTNSERRVQRVRKALDPPGNARDDMGIIQELARRLGRDWNYGSSSLEIAENAWNEVRSLSPEHTGMTYARLEAEGGLRWPCMTEDDPGASFLHGRLWETDPEERGMPAPFSVVLHELPVDELTEDFPLRLTTGRRLSEFNTGVQTGGYASPLRTGETLDLSPEDMQTYDVKEGDIVKVTSRRGSIEAPVRIDEGLRPGLAFMTFHFPDEVDVNVITIDATDPKAGTAEFKAAAVRIEKVAEVSV